MNANTLTTYTIYSLYVAWTWQHACMHAFLTECTPLTECLPPLQRMHAGSARLKVFSSTGSSMAPVISFQPTATTPNSQPSLPRSGACAATLPPGHSHDVILFGGYTEQQQPSMQRDPTNEAWLFSKASGSWSPVKYSSEAVPCTRLVAQCVVVGNKLWLIGKSIWLMHSLQGQLTLCDLSICCSIASP